MTNLKVDKKLFIKIFKYLIIPLGMLYVLFKRKRNITILMYHRVNDSVSKELSVTNANFLWQMEYLNRKGYKVISLDEAILSECISNENKKEKYIVLTFDDGYEDYFTNAFPVLSEFGYPSIIYLVPGYVETDNVYWWDNDLGESKLMNWIQINELKNKEIVQFGSHSMSHPDFNQLNEKKIEEELCLSQEILQQKLILKVRHFSYPRGIVTRCAKDKIKTIYDTAVSIFDGYEIVNDCEDDYLMQLKRVPVQRSDGRYLFIARLKGWLDLEEYIKKVIRHH